MIEHFSINHELYIEEMYYNYGSVQTSRPRFLSFFTTIIIIVVVVVNHTADFELLEVPSASQTTEFEANQPLQLSKNYVTFQMFEVYIATNSGVCDKLGLFIDLLRQSQGEPLLKF